MDWVPELIRAGEKLARPALRLRKAQPGETVVGVLGGRGIVPATEETVVCVLGDPGILPAAEKNAVHGISIDCGWHVRHGFDLSGCLSVYAAGMCCITLCMGRDRAFPTGDLDGMPLTGDEVPMLPPLAALCAYGGEPVEQWLTSLGRTRADGQHPGVQKSEAGRKYERELRQRSPLREDADRVNVYLGGWTCWPEADGSDLECRVVLCKFAAREPEVEVVQEPDGELAIGCWVT